MSAKLVTMYWRDIPAQVSAQAGRNRQSVMLEDRFEKDIDRAAMVAGLIGSDDYLAQWRRTSRACGDDLAAEAAAEVGRIHAAYPRERVNSFVLNGGFDPEGASSAPPAPNAEPSVEPSAE
jgi:Virulence factor